MYKQIRNPAVAAGTIAVLSLSSIVSADADNNLRGWASKAAVSVDDVMKYPAMAARQNAEGLVTYRVTIDRDGEIVKSKRTKKTTSTILNSASRGVIRRAEFPALPAGYEKDTMTFAVHLTYAIADNYFEEMRLKRRGRVTSQEVASRNGPLTASIEIIEDEE